VLEQKEQMSDRERIWRTRTTRKGNEVMIGM
jgi:hypothetical protein